MLFKARPDTFSYYRLVFVILLFAGGIYGIGTFVLEPRELSYMNLALASEAEREAIFIGFGIGGALSFLYGSLLLYLISDRRMMGGERRQSQVSISFADRRSGIDRRLEPAAYNRHYGISGPVTKLS